MKYLCGTTRANSLRVGGRLIVVVIEKILEVCLGYLKNIFELLLQIVCDVLATNLVEFVDGFADELYEFEFFVRVLVVHVVDLRDRQRTSQETISVFDQHILIIGMSL